jgi:type IV secretory pathway VirB2 component (pilin)
MSAFTVVFFVVVVAFPIVMAFVTKSLAVGRGRDTTGERVGWFLAGLFFPIVAVIVVLALGEKHPRIVAPPRPDV